MNPEQSPLIQMILKLQTQTNTTNNIQHQETETSIHTIQPNQIIKAQQENYLNYWKETTEKQSKLKWYLALNRDYITAEYLSTVKDCKLRQQTEQPYSDYRDGQISPALAAISLAAQREPYLPILYQWRSGDRATLPHQLPELSTH